MKCLGYHERPKLDFKIGFICYGCPSLVPSIPCDIYKDVKQLQCQWYQVRENNKSALIV